MCSDFSLNNAVLTLLRTYVQKMKIMLTRNPINNAYCSPTGMMAYWPIKQLGGYLIDEFVLTPWLCISTYLSDTTYYSYKHFWHRAPKTSQQRRTATLLFGHISLAAFGEFSKCVICFPPSIRA